MRHWRGGRFWRAAAVALAAGAIVAYADPAPPIERTATVDGYAFVHTARQIVALAGRTAATLSLPAAEAHAGPAR